MNILRQILQFSQVKSNLHNITSKIGFVRDYAFKSDLKIKWVRPEKIPCYKPQKSGDLSPMNEIDKNEYQLEYRNCKELEDANDLVKKLFTLEFAPRWKVTQMYIKEMVDTVRRHPLDKGSAEARIARWTGAIRALQEVMEKYPRNKKLKVKLKELIEKRKKHLKYLRRWDYKRFEWLLDALNIVYKSPPKEFHRVTRKDSLRKLTDKYCDDLMNEKLTAYKLKLEAEQPSFLEEKIQALEFLRQEQIECGVTVTITEEEIAKTKRQLEDLIRKREENNSKESNL